LCVVSPNKSGLYARPMETFTKAELLAAIGDPYQAEIELWARRVEQWTIENILHAEDEENRSSRARKRYSREEVYVTAVLFRLYAEGFTKLSVLSQIGWTLRGPWLDPAHPAPAFVADWNACKKEEPGTLIIGLAPNPKRGFGDDEPDTFVFVSLSNAKFPKAKAPSGMDEYRLNLTGIFATVRLPPEPRALELSPAPMLTGIV
jgi:hypothetical protein